MGRVDRDPEVEARELKRRFQAVTSRRERVDRRRRMVRRLARITPVLLVTAGLVVGGFMNSPWPPGMTIRHLAAFPGCAMARWVQLAPARTGDPGYHPRLDRDRDGIACEPWTPP